MRYLFAIIALGLLIAVHELGHLLAARALGIRVRRFSIGFGPPIFSWVGKRTEWRLGAFLLGGNVQIYGTNPHEEGALTAHDSFLARPWWARELVLVSGSVLNFVLAIAVLVALFVSGTHVPVPMSIGTVEPGSVAARAQLVPGDVIVQVDGQPVREWGAFVERVVDSPGRPLALTVRRDGLDSTLTVVPRPDERGAGRLGVTQQYVFREHSVREALPLAFEYIGRLISEGLELLWRLLLGKPGADVVSPVVIVKQASDVAKVGWDAFFRVVVHLSIALALFNLIPLPALDGGRMIFTAIERLRGRPVDARVETLAHTIGFFVLLGLTLWIATGEVRARLASQQVAAPAGQDGTSAAPQSADAGR